MEEQVVDQRSQQDGGVLFVCLFFFVLTLIFYFLLVPRLQGWTMNMERLRNVWD